LRLVLEISKIDYNSAENGAHKNKQQTEKVLYIIFEGLLRALHPIMPFVTDELWNQLPKANTKEALSSILTLNYPIANLEYINDKAEKEMDFLMRLIRSIRNIRQTYNIPHSAQIDVIFQAAPEHETLIKQYVHYIEKLTPVKLAAKTTTTDMPDRCATDTIDKTVIYIPLSSIIDIQKTKDKLLQRKQSIEKEWRRTKQIIESNEFKAKAPPEKVAAVEGQLASTQTQIDHLEAQLKVLN